jgi:hypothetical protein
MAVALLGVPECKRKERERRKMERDERDEDAQPASGATAASSSLFSSVMSFWGISNNNDGDGGDDQAADESAPLVGRSDEKGQHHEEDPKRMGDKESSFDEQPDIIAVDLDSLPAAVIFGSHGRVRNVGSSVTSGRAELRRLKEELAMVDSDGCARHHSRDLDDEEAEAALEDSDSQRIPSLRA